MALLTDKESLHKSSTGPIDPFQLRMAIDKTFHFSNAALRYLD